MKKYYIGLDIGTESVGIACTDEKYNLLRAKGKDLWAVRLMQEAEDASQRRSKRTARRRLQRRNHRIDLLQAIFSEMIEDKFFFLRLNNSGFWAEDKDERLGGTRFSLFNDKDFTDRQYHKRFPTIFHLRKALLEGKEKYDLRLYYLAIHHIIKYRGHFLFEGDNNAEAMNVIRLFNEWDQEATRLLGEDEIKFNLEEENAFFEKVCSAKSIRDKVAAGVALFDVTADNKRAKEWITLFVGGSAKPVVLFEDEEYSEHKSLSFSKMSDEEYLGLDAVYGDDFELIAKAKAIYDYMRFAKVLKNNRYISEAMVAIYDKHASDLKRLRKLLKKDKKLYKEVLKSDKIGVNYANYVGHTEKGKKKEKVKKCKPEDFFKYLKKVLTENASLLSDEKTYYEILEDMEDNNFLPKILHSDNGLFPHQVNGDELKVILENLCRDYPAFTGKDEQGYCIKDKITAIFKFKIPYYVGPLNTTVRNGKGNGWMVRKEVGEITPWNFNEKVDLTKSNEAFMRRMTNKCTYLHGKDVLPRASIIYQRYNVLNQLNKLRINEEPIGVELKQSIFNGLYLKQSVVKMSDIKNYLVKIGRIAEKEKKDMSLTGFEEGAKLSMSSYITMKRILGDIVDKRPDICENIILWHTLNTDKKLVENLIRDNYGDIAEVGERIKELKGLAFKDFGRLSKEFLMDLEGGVNDVTGEVYTILGELNNTNKNLNEILNDEKYSFGSAIEAENGVASENITYEDVEDLYVSPQVRRGIWQALQMTEEYVDALGSNPDKIFIEVTRSDGEKNKRTQSRKNRLIELYTAAKDINSHLGEKLKEEDDFNLRQERLYLWYLQEGKCAYTGAQIDLDQLNGDMYDVDHIVPRALTKDDSIDNKVLVLREKNGAKTDTYPLPEGFTNQQDQWKVWKQKGLMSEKKYKLLTRTSPLTEEDLSGFIAKQLVVTGQTTKAVAELLKRKYASGGTKIVFSKGENVSDFRNKFDIIKCRETNDLHHARDAYLNIVVGNVYDTVFSSWKEYFYQSNTVQKNLRNARYTEEREKIKAEETERKNYNLEKLFYRNQGNAWEKDSTILTVKNMLKKPSMIVTRYSFENKGAFYDETVYGRKDNAALPRKGKGPFADVKKYGGYNSPKTAYFVIINSADKKGKEIKTIEAIDVMTKYRIGDDVTKIQKELEERGIASPQVVCKLKIQSLLDINGTRCYLAGKTENRILIHNAVEWFTTQEQDRYIKAIAKLLEMVKEGKIRNERLINEEFYMHKNRRNESKLVIDKEKNGILYDEILRQLDKTIYKGLSSMTSFGAKVADGKEAFCLLSTLDQCKVILQIVKFLKCNAEAADLTLIGKEKTCGKLLIGKNITGMNISVIDRSPCGLSERIRKI